MSVDALVVLLEAHRYSASPWRCRCGEFLGDAQLSRHVAEIVLAALRGVSV